MPQGTIESFDPESNTGRLTPEDGSESLPFDGHAVTDRRPGENLQAGREVTYDVDDSEDEPRAINITHVADRGYG